MKVTQYNNRYLIRCSQHEFEILQKGISKLSKDDLETGHRRSWARRTYEGDFLRVDKDRTKDYDF